MATNHNKTLFKDYTAAVLAKEKLEREVQILNAQCHKLENFTINLAAEKGRLETVAQQQASS